MRPDEPTETQKVTSESKQWSPQIFTTGVHPKFYLEISPILDFVLIIEYFPHKKIKFSLEPGDSLLADMCQWFSSQRKTW